MEDTRWCPRIVKIIISSFISVGKLNRNQNGGRKRIRFQTNWDLFDIVINLVFSIFFIFFKNALEAYLKVWDRQKSTLELFQYGHARIWSLERAKLSNTDSLG